MKAIDVSLCPFSAKYMLRLPMPEEFEDLYQHHRYLASCCPEGAADWFVLSLTHSFVTDCLIHLGSLWYQVLMFIFC
jgi:hypothetical protein